MGVAFSPTGGEIASWATKKVRILDVCPLDRSDRTKPSNDQNKPDTINSTTVSMPDRTVYFASSSLLSDQSLEFYAETYTLFTSLQRIVATSFKLPSPTRGGWDEKLRLAELNRLVGPPSAETIGHMSRVVALYLEEVGKVRESQDVDVSCSWVNRADRIQAGVRSRFDAIYHILHLAEILFLPRDGRGEGLLGEELLDWVNDVDPGKLFSICTEKVQAYTPAPDNTQGNEIMQSNPPWDHPAFWPYLSRCLLRGFHLPASTFLRSLINHPHPPISKLASLLSSQLSQLPRSHNVTAYPLDHQFLSAHKQWLMRFRAEFATFTAGKQTGWLDENGGAKYIGLENDFRVVIELMEGKRERVLEEANDWREAVGAWGILVDVGLRRDDLP